MNNLQRALVELTSFLDHHQVPYMIIGGIANLVWGEPRSTLDVDATVLVEETKWPELLKELGRTFTILPKDPLAILHEMHVLPLETHDEIRLDLIWARLPYEQKAIARAATEEIAGRQMRVCTPEDLIIHKIVSERVKDREDVRQIIRRQGSRLDRRYLTTHIRTLATAMDQPELLTFLNACFSHRKK